MGRGPKPAKSEGAKPLGTRKLPKDDGSVVGDVEKRLAEALRDKAEAQEQQEATAEILRIIGSAPGDARPVFDAIAVNALRLCDAVGAVVVRYEGNLLHVVAHHNVSSEAVDRMKRQYPLAPDRQLPMGRAVLEGTVVHVVDLQATEEFSGSVARQFGARGHVSIPLLHQGRAIGAIGISRRTLGPFSDRQIALLQTFAAQAVIAIENVRLFNETKEALEQQTATAEILGVISRSPTDIQPVLDAVAESAQRLCEAFDTNIYLIDGEVLRLVAHHGPIAVSGSVGGVTHPLVRGLVSSRAVLDRQPVHVADLLDETEQFPESRAFAQRLGHRTQLSVPLLKEGMAIGAIAVRRTEVRPFTDRQVALLQTFADQAVIAIENVRLFTELQEKNRAITLAHAQVTEALEQQTATSEILRVISSSPTDVQPVFDTIVESAARLCDAVFSSLASFDGEVMDFVAAHNWTPAAWAIARRTFPAPPSRARATGRAILERAVVHMPDVELDHEYGGQIGATGSEISRAVGFRSLLSVPMLRDGVPLGALAVARVAPGPFSDNQIALLKTFADQAVIAIENVRLFTELETRNAELREALDHQTATAEVLAIISRSPTDVQPVFAAIARSAAGLCEAELSAVYRYDGELIHVAANTLRSSEQRDAFARLYPMPPGRGTPVARAILERRTQHVPDTSDDPEYLALLASTGFRSALAVPMVREGAPIGAIAVGRMKVREFTAAQIQLLETFADQAVIAIENVRLFTELQEKNNALTTAHAQVTEALDQQTATSEILRVISSSPTDVQPVFDTIVASAARLCDADFSAVARFEEGLLHLVAVNNMSPAETAAYHTVFPRAPGRHFAVGRAFVDGRPVHIEDIEADPDYDPWTREVLQRAAVYRTFLAVPILQSGVPIGAIGCGRHEMRPFTALQIALLQTFADQAVIAIENVRLFTELETSNREIADKSRQLEVASQHKSEFLANMSHELRTPLNAIIGFSEVLSERMFGELNEKQEEYSKDIHAFGQHLLSLINDILDLSKIEAGRMELELTDFHLPTALDSALTLVRERAGRRGIALQMDVDSRLGQILADERKVRQVVLNLLSNAIKFTPEGGRIEVAAVPKDGSVEVSVSDTGVGIAPEDQEAVFEEFRQVGTAAKKVEGTGLGLTLCRKFVELHGGKIWVTSQVGVGSTFTFTIPVRRGE
jgi:signal transduction histidine kinase/putative methionine-R-sulfoxide reductase with GAF domain